MLGVCLRHSSAPPPLSLAIYDVEEVNAIKENKVRGMNDSQCLEIMTCYSLDPESNVCTFRDFLDPGTMDQVFDRLGLCSSFGRCWNPHAAF